MRRGSPRPRPSRGWRGRFPPSQPIRPLKLRLEVERHRSPRRQHALVRAQARPAAGRQQHRRRPPSARPSRRRPASAGESRATPAAPAAVHRRRPACPCRIAAASSKSLARPLVHVPSRNWSICVPATSSTLASRCPPCAAWRPPGSSVARSYSLALRTSRPRRPRPARSVRRHADGRQILGRRSSTGKTAILAPISTPMLAIVKRRRSSGGRSSPWNSTHW